MNPHFLLSVGWLVRRSVLISYKGETLHLQAPMGAQISNMDIFYYLFRPQVLLARLQQVHQRVVLLRGRERREARQLDALCPSRLHQCCAGNQ